MKKILYILNTGLYSGAENVVIQIISNLDKTKYTGIYAGLEGEIGEILKEKGIAFESMQALTPKNLQRVIDKTNPDIIHANDYTAVCVAALCKTKAPVIAHLHNNSTWITRINSRTALFAFCVRKCKYVLTVSDAITKEFAFRSVLKRKSKCIGNPVNVKMIRDRYDEKTGKEYDIIVLGRLSEAKNPELYLNIIKEISNQRKVKAVVVGDGELRDEVNRLVCELALDDVVELAGFQKNPYEYVAKSRVMLMPSKWEGFGLAAVEGLAYGVPVVASNAGGLPDIVTDACGKICKEKDEYVKEIIKLLDDEDYYRLKAKAAIERADEMDNTGKYFAEINHIYDSLIDRDG